MNNIIITKTPQEIKIMQTGGQKLAEIRDNLEKFSAPGISLIEIETKAQKMIKKASGELSFARVPNYNWATCLNVNDGFVHGIPNQYVLRDGDVLSIDIGIYYRGYNTDTATTFLVGKNSDNQQNQAINRFLATGKQTLNKAIKTAKAGRHIGHISQVIQKEIEKNGYSVARHLTGHGIGRSLHEPPKIPCFLDEDIAKTPKIIEGMTIAVEVLYLQGSNKTYTDKDSWTIKSKDGKITGIFEKTIAITVDGCVILT